MEGIKKKEKQNKEKIKKMEQNSRHETHKK